MAVINGTPGNDNLVGTADDDTIDGLAGNDTINGLAGNDTLTGGTGDDTVNGGAGNDTIYVGDGTDTVDAGDDEDTIIVTNTGTGGPNTASAAPDTGTTIHGGSGGVDNDTLDLTAWGPDHVTVAYDANPENGTVTFWSAPPGDPGRVVISTLTFTEIENVIICFTPGTQIETAEGLVAVEDLRSGDMVLTRDSGYQPVAWTGRRDLDAGAVARDPNLWPVRIAAGALGNGLPERDMEVSPQHRMLLTGSRAELLFGESEVLAAAVHLVGQPGITRAVRRQVSYIHVMFDVHEIIRADGTWTESFQPGEQVMNAMEEAVRDEILQLFPELATGEYAREYPSARISLKAHEVKAFLAA